MIRGKGGANAPCAPPGYAPGCTVHWFILETTLNLRNISALLESHKWYGIGPWINIPSSKLNKIERQHSADDLRCSDACWELYLKDHPSPTWKGVAYALYQTHHLEELEVVLKKYMYLKGKWAMISSVVYNK